MLVYYADKRYLFIEQDFSSGFNMILQGLGFLHKQVQIEDLQPITRSQSISFTFEVINFLRKIQK